MNHKFLQAATFLTAANAQSLRKNDRTLEEEQEAISVTLIAMIAGGAALLVLILIGAIYCYRRSAAKKEKGGGLMRNNRETSSTNRKFQPMQSQQNRPKPVELVEFNEHKFDEDTTLGDKTFTDRDREVRPALSDLSGDFNYGIAAHLNYNNTSAAAAHHNNLNHYSNNNQRQQAQHVFASQKLEGQEDMFQRSNDTPEFVFHHHNSTTRMRHPSATTVDPTNTSKRLSQTTSNQTAVFRTNHQKEDLNNFNPYEYPDPDDPMPLNTDSGSITSDISSIKHHGFEENFGTGGWPSSSNSPVRQHQHHHSVVTSSSIMKKNPRASPIPEEADFLNQSNQHNNMNQQPPVGVEMPQQLKTTTPNNHFLQRLSSDPRAPSPAFNNNNNTSSPATTTSQNIKSSGKTTSTATATHRRSASGRSSTPIAAATKPSPNSTNLKTSSINIEAAIQAAAMGAGDSINSSNSMRKVPSKSKMHRKTSSGSFRGGGGGYSSSNNKTTVTKRTDEILLSAAGDDDYDDDAENPWLMETVAGTLGPRAQAADMASLGEKSNRSKSSVGNKSSRSRRSQKSNNRSKTQTPQTSTSRKSSNRKKTSNDSVNSKDSRRSQFSHMSDASRSIAADLLRLETQLAMVGSQQHNTNSGSNSVASSLSKGSSASRTSRNSSRNNRGASGRVKTTRRDKMNVVVPPGKLGVILANRSENQGTIVSDVRPQSVLYGKIFPGDRIVAVDNEDVSSMTVAEITALMARKAAFDRTLTILTSVKLNTQRQ